MINPNREQIEKMARKLAIKGEEDLSVVPPFTSLRGNSKFVDFPEDARVNSSQHKSNVNGKLKVHWDQGSAVFGKDSGRPYDRILIYYNEVMVFDPSMWDKGEWEDELSIWYNSTFPGELC